jgi:putative nucleotidyltransferase with HDIG domain
MSLTDRAMCPAEPIVQTSRGSPPTAEANASVPLTTVLRVTEGLRRVFSSPAYKPPMLPSAALEIHRLSCTPDVDTDKLIALLERDPMLAGQVLKVANSPLFRGRDAETSLRSAVLRLGLKNLGEVVFELALHMRVFRSADYSDAMEDLRRHSTACANLARLLATLVGQDPENAFLCGLLHDIGTAAILIVLGERRKSEPPLETAVLDEVVRQAHEDVSGMLVRLWKLPGDTADVVSHHHGRAAVESAPLLSSIVVVADSLSAKFGFSVDFGRGACDGADHEAATLAREKLGLDVTAMASVEEQARKILGRLDETLKHRRADLPDAQPADGPVTDKAADEKLPPAPAKAAVSARRSPTGLLARIWRALMRSSKSGRRTRVTSK